MNAKQLGYLVKSYNGSLIQCGQNYEGTYYELKSRWDDQDEADDFFNDNRIEIESTDSDFEDGIWTVWFNLKRYECPDCGEADFAKSEYHHCR